MSTGTTAFTPHQTLSDLATTYPGASRVFGRHGLDFCCHGRIRLEDACQKEGLDVAQLLRELESECASVADFERWDQRPLPELIEHVLTHYHAGHRAELPRLLELARKVEEVHGHKPGAPRGLVQHLELVQEALELHMQKEEQMLFPMILAGRGAMVAFPIQVMEEEHDDHGRNLARLRELCFDYTLPEGACGTWTALYLRLEELEREVMQHIHLENNILFARALRG